MEFTYTYPRPAVTVDGVIFRKLGNEKQVLLIRRLHAPFEGCWAFPGGFVDMDETLEAAVAREIEEETGLQGLNFSQFHTYGDPGRDPRHRTITVVFTAMANENHIASANDDAIEVGWFDINNLPELA
ncbi:MAG: NUDIX hydrolase, partial [Bacteroidales bacterium]|nr:NUDIX hydrolase [Bacteroidales bacterium]